VCAGVATPEADAGKHDEGEAPSRKRRFVWPGELHHSFVSAVFDLGLRCATSCAVKRMLPSSDDGVIDYLLDRYRSARKIEEDDDEARPAAVDEPARAADSVVAQRSVEIAQRQMAIAAECENMLRSFRPRLRARHRELCEALRFEDLATKGRHSSWPSTIGLASADTPHLQMEHHMNLHRRMLGTRALQLATDRSDPRASDAAAAAAISDLHRAKADLSDVLTTDDCDEHASRDHASTRPFAVVAAHTQPAD